MKKITLCFVILVFTVFSCRKAGNDIPARDGSTEQPCSDCITKTDAPVCVDEFEPCNNSFRAYCNDGTTNNETHIPYTEEYAYLKRNVLHYNDIDNWYLWTDSPIPEYGFVLRLKICMKYAPTGLLAPVYTVALHPHFVIPPNLYSPWNRFSQKIRCDLNNNTATIVAQQTPSPSIEIISAFMEEGCLVVDIKKNAQLWGKGLQLRIGNSVNDGGETYWGNNEPGCYTISYQWLGH